MRRIVLGLIFLLVLGVAIAAYTPLGFVLEQSGLKQNNVGWAKVDGTLRQGRVSGFFIQNQPIGDVSLKLRLSSLLSLKPTYDVQWGGAGGRGSGVISVSASAVEADQIRAEQHIGALEGLTGPVRAFGGTVRFREGAFRLTREGCTAAAGRLSTNVLSQLAAEYGRSFSDLAGPVQCAEGRFLVTLNADSEAGDDVEIRANASLTGTAAFQMNVKTVDNQIALALSQYGFQTEGDVWVYRYSQ